MPFIQIMEMKTRDPDQLQDLGERWRDETQGKRARIRTSACQDMDKPDTYIVIAEFDSYEEAMRNSQLPVTNNFAEQMAKLAEGPITYRNLDVMDQYID